MNKIRNALKRSQNCFWALVHSGAYCTLGLGEHITVYRNMIYLITSIKLSKITSSDNQRSYP